MISIEEMIGSLSEENKRKIEREVRSGFANYVTSETAFKVIPKYWSQLDEDQKKEVDNIAKQIPWSFNDVAHVYINNGCNVLATMLYLHRTCGFIFLV